MNNHLKYWTVLLLMLCGLACNAFAQTEEENNQPQEILIDDSFFHKEHGLLELNEVIEKFDTYDYVRTKNQKEELVVFLLKEFERLKYDLGIAKCKNILGVLKRDQALYAEAIELHESALKHSGNDTIQLVYSYNNLGVVYRRLDKPRMALDYHMEALKLAETFAGDPTTAKRSTCVALNSIGNINLTLNQPEKALEVFSQTLKIEQSLNNTLGVAINYQNIGYCYEADGKLDVALVYYKKSLHENEKIGSDVGRCICYNSIGEILIKQQKTFEALETFNKAMIFAELTADDYYISQIHANIGTTYLELKNYKRALPELLQYREMAQTINSGKQIQDSYKKLSRYFEETGEPDRALFLYKQAVLFNDSIMNEKNSRYLNELQTLYESKKKEQQIELLTVENKVKTQQNYFYLLGVVMVFLVAVVIYISSRRKSDARNNELEARLFRSLMNPHFIFNALGSIQSFLYKNEPDKAANYLGHFSKLTRSILQNSNKELITLADEINALRNYIEIEQMRQQDGFSYDIETEDDIELDFIYVPPTIIQPFVENAIHHGLSKQEGKQALLQIKLTELPGYIRIQIIDNGKGIKTTLADVSNTKHKSMGMNIFRERVRIIEKKYKKSVIFDIKDRSDIDPNQTGTIITIDFPLIEPND